MPQKPKETVVSPGSATTRATALPVTVWKSDNYSEDWYRDALAEAQSGDDQSARRREIIFAACFAESFIFEWARRKLQIEEIEHYFPSKPRHDKDPRYRRNLKSKWKELPGELYQAGKIKVRPDLDLSRLGELLRYRNGLIHASASRPATQVQPPKTKPFPRKKDLRNLKAGWAVTVVFDLVSDFCDQLQEAIPDYLQKP